MPRDYYIVLGIQQGASSSEIKKAYRNAIKRYHPDKIGESADPQKFRAAREAYEVLSDPEKRQRYDRYGHAGLDGVRMHDFSGMGVEDIFSMFGFDDFFERHGSFDVDLQVHRAIGGAAAAPQLALHLPDGPLHLVAFSLGAACALQVIV
mgnify:CR=1 FL=1